MKLTSAYALVILVATSLAVAGQQPTATAPVIVQMSYYAKPGSEADVLRLRLRAAEVLVQQGLTRGRVWQTTDSPRATKDPVGATVLWQGEFANDAMLRTYEKIADNHPDFLAIRKEMGNFTIRTERRYFRAAR